MGGMTDISGAPPKRGINSVTRTAESLGPLPPRGIRKILLNSMLPWRHKEPARLDPTCHSMHTDVSLALRNPTARDVSNKSEPGVFAANAMNFVTRVM